MVILGQSVKYFFMCFISLRIFHESGIKTEGGGSAYRYRVCPISGYGVEGCVDEKRYMVFGFLMARQVLKITRNCGTNTHPLVIPSISSYDNQ